MGDFVAIETFAVIDVVRQAEDVLAVIETIDDEFGVALSQRSTPLEGFSGRSAGPYIRKAAYSFSQAKSSLRSGTKRPKTFGVTDCCWQEVRAKRTIIEKRDFFILTKKVQEKYNY